MATKKNLKIVKSRKTTGNILSAESLFAAGTAVAVPIEIDEIQINGKAGVLYIRPLSAHDVIDFMGVETKTPEEQHNAMVTIITKSVVNPDGSPMFSSESDVEKLRNLRFKVFTAISAAVNEVAGLGAKVEAGKG